MEKQDIQQVLAVGILAALGTNVLLCALGWVYLSSQQGQEQLRMWLTADTHVAIPQVTSTDESQVINVVEAASPAVVSIVITKDVPVLERYYEEFRNPFGGLFGGTYQIPQYRQNGTESKEVGGGSGFLVSQDGYIVTNAHVVSDLEAKYSVFLNDGSSHDATVIAADSLLDVAVLKIEGEGYTYLAFGDSSNLKAGQTVIAIGNALGEFSNTVSMGVVSGLARSIVASTGAGQSEQLTNIIQTDAAINPGNSGGPLLDLSGRVIGVNVAATVGSAENIGFALPANIVQKSVDSIRENGRVIRPYMGVRYRMINEAMQTDNKLDVDYGALVVRGDTADELAIIPGSPADKAGLEENDIILEVNGQILDSDHPLNLELQQFQVGDTITLKVRHDGDDKTVMVTLEEAPQDSP